MALEREGTGFLASTWVFILEIPSFCAADTCFRDGGGGQMLRPFQRYFFLPFRGGFFKLKRFSGPAARAFLPFGHFAFGGGLFARPKSPPKTAPCGALRLICAPFGGFLFCFPPARGGGCWVQNEGGGCQRCFLRAPACFQQAAI